MDDRLRICLWMAGGGGFGAVLGGVFGAVTAALYARSGGAAGTRLARQAVDTFLQSGERQPSPIGRAALIGAADGFFFLGTLGLVAGAFLGKSGRTVDESLVPMVLVGVLLIGGAIFFGALAYNLTYLTARFLYGFAGSILGSFIVASLLGSVYGSAGCVLGMFVGGLICHAVRRYSPKFQTPRVGNPLPQPHSESSTDITEPSYLRPGSDAIRKPDADDEQ